MVNYQLLALDLDETLLTKDKQITDETKYWISQAIEAGVTVVFATGRGLQRVKDFREALNLDTPMVLVNGAEVWVKPGKLLARHYIDREDIRMLHRIAIESGASYWGYSVESLTGPRTWTDEMFDRDWMKFGIRHEDFQVMDKIKERLEDFTTLEVTSSSPTNLEFSLKGVSKKSGVSKICELLNIDMDKVMAVGDNLNDLQLIQSAGLGVAMGNADIQLKEAADEITGSNEENGVAKAIKRYLFGINQDENKKMLHLGDL